MLHVTSLTVYENNHYMTGLSGHDTLMATKSYCRKMHKECVYVCVLCNTVSINLCWPGVFSSLHSCFPQTGPTELCALMCVCVCVCVNLWQSDGLTGGMILSEGCFFQTPLSSSSLTFFPFSLQRPVRSGPSPLPLPPSFSARRCTFFFPSHSLLPHCLSSAAYLLCLLCLFLTSLCCVPRFSSFFARIFCQNQFRLRRIDIHSSLFFLYFTAERKKDKQYFKRTRFIQRKLN